MPVIRSRPDRHLLAETSGFQRFSPRPVSAPERVRTYVKETDRRPAEGQSLPQPCQASPVRATKKPLCRAFLMGGTGLEPVTPSLSTRRTLR